MKLLPRWPLTPPLAAALLALLGGLAVPSAARASCGDYVMVGGHAAHEAPPAHPARTATGSPARPTPADPVKRPCNGPLCSGAPVLPAPAPLAPPPAHADHWGFLADPAALAPPQPFASLADDDHGRPVRRPSSVYHPPR